MKSHNLCQAKEYIAYLWGQSIPSTKYLGQGVLENLPRKIGFLFTAQFKGGFCMKKFQTEIVSFFRFYELFFVLRILRSSRTGSKILQTNPVIQKEIKDFYL